MPSPLPDRRPRAAGQGTPPARGAIIAVTVTISILAAFALGVLVGRNQASRPAPAVAPAETAPQTEDTPKAQDGPNIDMVRPDGTKAAVNPMPTPKAAAEPQAEPQAQEPIPVETPTKAQPAAKRPDPVASPKPKATPSSAKAAAKGIYTVQIAAFRDRESAERLSLTLESRGYDSYVQRSNVDGKGIWYRVRVGTFADKEQAREVAKSLEAKEGRSAYVTIR